MSYLPVRDHNARNGHYSRLAPPVVRLHSSFRAPMQKPRGWRLVAFDLVFRFGLPLLAFMFVLLGIVGLVSLITALGRAVRSLGGA